MENGERVLKKERRISNPVNRFKILITASAVITAIAVNLIAEKQKPHVFAGSAQGTASEEPATPLRLQLHSKNAEGGQTYFQGEPIVIQVGLIDKRFHGKAHLEKDKKVNEKTQGLTVGSKKWPWFRGLSMRVLRIEDTNGISLRIEDANAYAGKIADANSTLRTVPVLKNLNWPKRMTSPSPGAHVKNDVMYHALVSIFTLEPQISQSLRPGRYILQASWDSTGPVARNIDIWHGRLQAEPIEFVIVAVKTTEDKGKLAFSRAAYYIGKKDFDAALAEALKVEKLFPSYNMSQCYNIAAIAYRRKGDIRSAIEYYKKYLVANKDANPNRFPYITKVKYMVKLLEAQLKESADKQKRADPSQTK